MIRKQRSFVTHSFGLTTERTGSQLKPDLSIDAQKQLTEEQKLLIAIAEDDRSKFQDVAFSLEQIVQMKFESEMNVLNLAIDSNSTQIVMYLGAVLN